MLYLKKRRILKKLARAMRSKQGRYEGLFADVLTRMAVKFHAQHVFKLKGYGWAIADFYVPGNEVVFEIDGSIHSRPDVAEKDFLKGVSYQRRGIRVVRIQNDLFEQDEKLVERVVRSAIF